MYASKKYFLIIFLLLSINIFSTAQGADVTLNTTANIFFSPDGGCTDAIIKQIENARSEILVQAYSFTSKPIAAAIVKAKKAGVKIEIVLDKSNKSAKYSAADFTAHMGIPTFIDSNHAIAHNKVIIIDRESVITGSFNFTKAAEDKNAENLIIIRSKELANVYMDNWHHHRSHSEFYRGR